MGLAVCARLVEAGFRVTASDRDPTRRDPVQALGASWEESNAWMLRWAAAPDEARGGRLELFVGGAAESVARHRSLLEALGRSIASGDRAPV
jgi:3-hydroxyisobutyrate dehydrogenase-like beta-hydroxyacid dehydrogenase